MVPWGLLVGVELVALAIGSLMLVLGIIPSAFDVDWGCTSVTGKTRTAGDTYIAAFAVLGALGWLAAAGTTAVVHATGRRLALAVPAVWFGVLVLTALAVAAAIGPLPCA
jgi:hypothetical protein